MREQIKTLTHNTSIPNLALMVCGLIAAALTLTAEDYATKNGQMHASHHNAAPAKLVEIVRNATRQFTDVNAATAAGYEPFLGCVSGPDYGAMGVHYVNGTLVADGEIDATRPEALIYEPKGDQMQLVGVEFIVDAAAWRARHDSPPCLRAKRSISSTARTSSVCPHFSNCTSGLGGTTPKAPSWIGTNG